MVQWSMVSPAKQVDLGMGLHPQKKTILVVAQLNKSYALDKWRKYISS